MTPEEKEARDRVVQLTIERLELTYSDMIQQKGYDRIPDFFREHLYSPPNKDARDRALDSLYEKLKSVTGEEMTASIHKLILLNKLTDDLDLETGRMLLAGPLKKKPVGSIMTSPVTQDQLMAAIKKAGRKEDRLTQINMVAESLTFFFSLSKLPLIKLVMAPIKVAASLVGAMDLVETMEAGYVLSRGIKDMKPFVEQFVLRESAALNDLFGQA